MTLSGRAVHHKQRLTLAMASTLSSSVVLFVCILAVRSNIGDIVLEQQSSESQSTDCGCQGLKRDVTVDVSDENKLEHHDDANIYSKTANKSPHKTEHDIRSKVGLFNLSLMFAVIMHLASKVLFVCEIQKENFKSIKKIDGCQVSILHLN